MPCGSCSLCCKLLKVEALEKPADHECKHCILSEKGCCSIYTTRPKECHDFKCVWLQWEEQGENVPEWLKPINSHIVLNHKRANMVLAYVDPAYPDAWKAPAFIELARFLSKDYIFIVKISDQYYQILQDHIIPVDFNDDQVYAITKITPPKTITLK